LPKVQAGAVGKKCGGEKLVFYTCIFERANLQDALVLVSGDAEFFVRHLGELAARAIVNGDELGSLVNVAVTKTAAPGDGRGHRRPVEGDGELDVDHVSGVELQAFGKPEISIAPHEAYVRGSG